MTPHRSGLRALLSGTAVLAAVFPAAALSAEFAASGAAGTLIVKVEAVGGAKHNAGPGAGLDAREWRIKNSGQFTIRVKAMEPVGNDSPENIAKVEKTRDTYQRTVTEKDQDVIDKWEEKVDACNDNEACENRVRAQMLSDPQYQRIIQKMQGAGQGIVAAARAVDLKPRYQMWVSDQMDPSPASGSLQFDLTEKIYGAIDTAGGGKVDGTCRWNGSLKIAAGSAESKVGASFRVDSKTSKYEIRIPVDAFSARLTESCSDSKTGSHGPSKNAKDIPLIGAAPARGVKDFTQLLTFTGPVGSIRSPQLRGKHTVMTDWLDGSSPQPVPVKVTIEWQFSASGR